MRIKLQSRAGFTLIEIMIVVIIMAMIMAWGLPTFVRTFHREPLAQAVYDVQEKCEQARAAAILSGKPAMLIIDKDKGFSVSQSGGATTEPSSVTAARENTPGRVQLPDQVGIEILGVNFHDYIKDPEAPDSVPVHFFPNGTSDEFTMVLLDSTTNKRRQISLDVITGQATVKTESQLGM